MRGVEDDGSCAGQAIGVVNNGTLELDTLHVSPYCERQGWGSALLNALVCWAKGKGAVKMKGEFKPETGREVAAEEFYAKHGARIEGGDIVVDLE